MFTMLRQFPIYNIGDYIQAVIQIRPKSNQGYYFQWYRGQADCDWLLIPKVQRNFQGSEEDLFRKERYLTNDFQSRASLLHTEKPPLDDFPNWLTIMQHYGLSTRLLDWSRSPLVALYFAVADDLQEEKDACVWALTPGILNSSQNLEKPTVINGITYENSYIYNMSHRTIATMIYPAFRRWKLSSEESAITPEDRKFDHRFHDLADKIAACYPVEANSRVYNQFSAFTVHNSNKQLVNICPENGLFKIIIPHNVKQRLRWELEACGITESYIFPDYEHVAKEISRW